MSSQRLLWASGAVVSLASLGLFAMADPDTTIAGTYDLAGTQGSRASKVKLVVKEDGSVSRSVTFADGSAGESLSAKGTFSDPKTLRVVFKTVDGTPSTPTADPTNLTGAWTFTGRNGVGQYTGRGSFAKDAQGNWKGVFTYRYNDGSTGSMLLQGKVLNGALVGTRIRTTGLTGALGGSFGGVPYPIKYTLASDGKNLRGGYGPGNIFTESLSRTIVPTTPGGPGVPGQIAGVYTFGDQGAVSGNLTNTTGQGDWTSASESGKKSDELKVAIVSPANGTGVLAGQVLDVKVTPDGAAFEVVSGPARKTVAGKLQVTGDGPIVLVAKLADRSSDPITVSSVKPEVCELEVQAAQPISDAQPPHMKRALGSSAKPDQQPAAILLNEKLVLKATLKADRDLGVAAKVRVTATGAQVRLTGEGEVSALKNGATVTLTSDAPLGARIEVRKLALDFALEQDGASSVSVGSQLPLRVYLCFKPAIRNGPYYGEASRPIATKDHLEKACTWATGTYQNKGNGDTSVCWKLDNLVRHHVHPVDFKPNKLPFTSAYPWDSTTTPLNYADIDDAWGARSSGERGIGQLYYPPLEVHDAQKEDYSHYASNFGWWVLDNPTHTGGRCNQQASLMCDLFGTHGIKANVHYLQRVGVSKSGRPVRQYFNSSKGEMYWNFHGLAEAVMDDGQHWLYDGSFSFAPQRKNGLTEWAEAPGRWLHQTTPFIYEFGPWYYEDWMGGKVADNDIPSKHVDNDNPNPGEFYGVNIAPGETLNWYNHANVNSDGTVH